MFEFTQKWEELTTNSNDQVVFCPVIAVPVEEVRGRGGQEDALRVLRTMESRPLYQSSPLPMPGAYPQSRCDLGPSVVRRAYASNQPVLRQRCLVVAGGRTMSLHCMRYQRTVPANTTELAALPTDKTTMSCPFSVSGSTHSSRPQPRTTPSLVLDILRDMIFPEDRPMISSRRDIR